MSLSRNGHKQTSFACCRPVEHLEFKDSESWELVPTEIQGNLGFPLFRFCKGAIRWLFLNWTAV